MNGGGEKLKINSAALKKLAESKEWSIPELASVLGVDYSYLFRVLNGEKNGGSKLFRGIYNLCKDEGLNVEEYIFLTSTMSTNNAHN